MTASDFGTPETTAATHLLRELALDMLALLWPTQCVGCGRADRDLCAACRQELRTAAALREADPRLLQHVTLPQAPHLVALAAASYEGTPRELMVGFKHQGRTGFLGELAAQLRAPLAAAVAQSRSREPLLVTVPSRPVRVRERGYRHVDLIVRRAIAGPPVAQASRPRFVERALRTLPGRTGQVGLSAEERIQNAARIEVAPRHTSTLRGREVILVDDIVTTGATMSAAAQALTVAGATVCAVVAVCATDRRDQQRQTIAQAA